MPTAGLVSAERFVKGRLLRPGDALDVTLTDPQGRRKMVSFTIRRRAVPKRQTRCFAPDGTEVACTVGCLVGATVPPGDPCEGAGTRTRIPRSLYSWFARWRPGKTIFTKLRIVGLPAGVDVILICVARRASRCARSARACCGSGAGSPTSPRR